jgi:predicted glycoside hydrolase/deacetylase ChbG (UPF0249 family)
MTAMPTSPNRTLIVNADDLGFVPSVTRGIVEAIEHGIVRSTSLMVNTPHAESAVQDIARLTGRGIDVGVGLHFNIVVGEPLLASRALSAPNGQFLPLTTHVWRSMTGRLDLRAVEAELRAQLDRAQSLLTATGALVTHIDSHRHTHAIAGVYEVVTRVAREHGIAHVRHPVESGPTLLARPHARLATGILRMLAGTHAPYDDARFAGVALMRAPGFDRDLHRFIEALPIGRTELMVHPGYDSAELAAIDSYRAPRERELRALRSPAVREKLASAGIALAHFGATARPASAPTRGAPAGS